MILFKIARAILKPIAHIVFRLRSEGRENIPDAGAVIIASNHINLVDPGLHAFCIRRDFRSMAKAELFRSKFLAWLMRNLGAFPVSREKADRRSLTTASDILNDDGALLIFPEGTRSKTGEPGLFKAGAVALCAATGAPVVPAAILEPKGLRPFDRVTIRYGKPMTREELGLDGDTGGAVLRHAADRVRAEVLRMLAGAEDKQ